MMCVHYFWPDASRSCCRRANRGRSLLLLTTSMILFTWAASPAAAAVVLRTVSPAAELSAAPAPINQTYLVAVRIRRRFGFTLGCHDSLHTRAGYQFSVLEASVCSLLRKAAATAGSQPTYSSASRQPWFAVQTCRADRFLCDQGLPLAQVALSIRTGSAADAGSMNMAELQLRFRSVAHADDTEMVVDHLQIMDYNECGSEALNDCSLNAVCRNRPGSYECRCKAGYIDRSPSGGTSGKVCMPQCGQGYCANGGMCINADGASVCRCVEGYWGSTCEATSAEAVESSGHSAALVMALGSLSLVLAVAAFLVLWCRTSRRRGFPNLKADAFGGSSTTAVTAGPNYHLLSASRDSDKFAANSSLR